MPTSPLPRRGTKGLQPAPAVPLPRPLWPRLAVVGVLAVVAVVICVLPASLVMRFAPPSVQAEDFSGSLWHGSAGRITVGGRPAGALEWSLHPLALLDRTLRTDLHWVKGGFVLDGSADVTRTRLVASNVAGGGPIADLTDLGLGAGWRGSAAVRIAQITADLSGSGPQLKSAVGQVTVSDVAAPQVAAGANLGGYELRFDDPASSSGDDFGASLNDTGGPLQLSAMIHLSMKSRSGMLSGTVKERPEAPPMLRSQLDNLAQLRPRDSQGRVPIDLEFTF